MEDTIQQSHADLISLSRPLIREPNLPLAMRNGKEKADCISCNACLRFFRIPYTHCVALAKEQKKLQQPSID
jgi:2,4-dienoyl-CoA reductase-like NADH-dependent reductase (Old Yellow Enzyme family)